MKRKTIVFDFDGVIHKYSKGWQDGSIYDKPVPGIRELIEELREEYEVVIVSTRAKDQLEDMMKWLKKYSIKVDYITELKMPAIVYIDDRTILFNGNTLNLKHQIQNFKNWNEKNLELMKISSIEADELLEQRYYEIKKIMKQLEKEQSKEVIKILDSWIDIANDYIERG